MNWKPHTCAELDPVGEHKGEILLQSVAFITLLYPQKL